MIRFAQEKDIDRIREFIGCYWKKKNHIFSRDRMFFEYEHLIGEEVTYVISEDETGTLNGILGYIPYGKTKRDVMTVMWKVNHTSDPILGIRILQYLLENGDVRIAASPGIGRNTIGIYKFLGYYTGKMTQWYRLAEQTEYRIARIENENIPKPPEKQFALTEFKTFEELEKCFDFTEYAQNNPKPNKEKWYIEKRYFHHPIYQYRIFGIVNDRKTVETIVVVRVVECNAARIIRWIDCIGDIGQIKYITKALDDLMKLEEAEYIDCFEAGLPDGLLAEAGWMKVENSGNIIPNYFQPYVCENIDIYYFSTDEEIILFKGDGDQDRPS